MIFLFLFHKCIVFYNLKIYGFGNLIYDTATYRPCLMAAFYNVTSCSNFVSNISETDEQFRR